MSSAERVRKYREKQFLAHDKDQLSLLLPYEVLDHLRMVALRSGETQATLVERFIEDAYRAMRATLSDDELEALLREHTERQKRRRAGKSKALLTRTRRQLDANKPSTAVT